MEYDLIIIGAGPAGLTAALYGLRANKSVLVIESKSFGGQIINASKIENYPGIKRISGFDFATNLYEQVSSLGAKFVYETVYSVSEEKEVKTANNTYKGKAVIIATGRINKQLNIENENKLIGHGVSYCATCDGNFFKGRNVAVIGGGDTALEDALYLSDIVSKVYLIHRRDEFTGVSKLVEEVNSKDNIEIILNTNVISIKGENGIDSIITKDNNDNLSEIDVDGLFIAVGQVPNNNAFVNVCDVNEQGYFITSDGIHTKVPGIYVAGDNVDKVLRQLTTAVSDGSISATIAIREMK